MGILSSLVARLLGAPGSTTSPTGSNPLAHSVLQMLTDPSTGGLQGLVQSFHDKGLGGVVSSWVGTGANQPISPDQLTHALGLDRVQQIAQTTGRPANSVASELASLLPMMIDKLTPTGAIPDGSALAQGLATLRNSLSAAPASGAAPTSPSPRSPQ
jgi:uncharacterized protein YidB (DUF937 family)